MRRSTVKIILTAAMMLAVTTKQSSADEQVFGFVRGAETLPAGHFDLYQFATYRTGKNTGSYNGFDFDTELEYGFTDQFQVSAAIVNHYFNYSGGDLGNFNGYRIGGFEGSAKYRVLSPFKDLFGLAARVESGYLLYDEVGGFKQHEFYVAPEIDLQKNFRDDTIICDLDFGPEWAWGKQPAEQYDHEISLQAATGVAWRFAPNWFLGVEANIRAEYPLFDLNNFEHVVVYAGPSLHYSSKNWWATLTCAYQAWGDGVDEAHNGHTYAEETDWKIRLKVGFNF